MPWGIVGVSRFNSILVRLKGDAIHATLLHRFLFQFHTGSIKSKADMTKGVKEICFNSILVRLKGKIAKFFTMRQLKFQFHTGSIKRSVSTACRFPNRNTFQFHTGSIKSDDSTIGIRKQIFEFQFHTGSIKSRFCQRSFGRGNQVSIPYWFD